MAGLQILGKLVEKCIFSFGAEAHWVNNTAPHEVQPPSLVQRPLGSRLPPIRDAAQGSHAEKTSILVLQ